MLQDIPLATHFRPKVLSEFVGQGKIIGAQTWLYRAIKNDQVPSLIFWGPPGSGKTTLALIIAQETKAEFVRFSATSNGLKDLKITLERAQEDQRLGRKTILFIDEIHRWNKAQQDALLPQIENGTITLIGATTENPSFSVNSALLSRVKIVVLESLTELDLETIIMRAVKKLEFKLDHDAQKLIVKFANGDARQALNILESAAELLVEDLQAPTKKLKDKNNKNLSSSLIKKVINQPHLLYDKNGDEHYNLISALHKSLRGSNTDAAIYYLARMLEAGEDPLYIARRLIRFASEDIGLANNSALMLATATYEACHNIGSPECRVNLAHCVIYLAKSAKDITAYSAYQQAQQEVESSGNLPVPLHLRNAPTSLMKELNYGRDYKYSPLEDDSQQEYLPKKIKGKHFL